MEFCWMLPVIPNKVEECIRQSILAEQNHFDSLLVSSLPKGLDPWVLAASIGNLTESIRLLVAQNTNFAHPFTTSKALHSLNWMTNGRADLNVVTGSFVPELAKLGKIDNHAVRYRRTKEFVEVLQLLRLGQSRTAASSMNWRMRSVYHVYLLILRPDYMWLEVQRKRETSPVH